MFPVMETDILKNPTDTGQIGSTGLMMKSKDFTNLIHQTRSFWRVAPCHVHNIRVSLFLAAFTRYYRNRPPEKQHIKENKPPVLAV